MSHFSQSNLNTLEVSARSAAAYLDACDNGAKYTRLDPGYYQACAKLLLAIFSVVDAAHAFPGLVEESAAARDIVKTIEMGRRIQLSRIAYFPEMTVVINRASA
nr:hypothetical protein [Dechloromonas sp.]